MKKKLKENLDKAIQDLRDAGEARITELVTKGVTDEAAFSKATDKLLEASKAFEVFRSRDSLRYKITQDISRTLEVELSDFVRTKLSNIKVAIVSMTNCDSVIKLLTKELGEESVDTDEESIQDSIYNILMMCEELVKM